MYSLDVICLLPHEVVVYDIKFLLIHISLINNLPKWKDLQCTPPSPALS